MTASTTKPNLPQGRPRLAWWRKLNLPLRVGLLAALAGMLLTTVGILRGFVPPTFGSIAMALLISGGSWGVVSWAVTTAVVDVEQDAVVEGDDG